MTTETRSTEDRAPSEAEYPTREEWDAANAANESKGTWTSHESYTGWEWDDRQGRYVPA